MAEQKLFTIQPTNNNYFAEFCMNSGTNSSSTQKAYRTDCNQIANHLFGKDMIFVKLEEIQGLKLADVVKLQNDMVATGLKSNTVNRKMQSFNSYLNFLRANGCAVNDIVSGLHSKKNSDEEQHEVMSLEHYHILFNAVNRVNIKMLFETALFTGLRKQGLYSITKKDVYEKEGKFYVETIEKGSIKVVRQITENSYKFIVNSDKENPLSVRPNDLTDLFKRFEDEIGVKYSLHSIRKLAINEVMNKSDLKTAQMFANHASASTTLSHYLKGRDDSQNVGMDLINRDKVTEEDFSSYEKDDIVKAIMNLNESDKQKILSLLEKQ